MAENDGNQAEQAEPEEQQPPGKADPPTEEQPFDERLAKERLFKANTEAGNLRKRLKELEPVVQRAKELEDSRKTDTERLSEERDSHRTRADKAEAQVARLQVALNKGLTVTQAKRLVGATEEELEADAEELLASFRPAETPGKEPPATGRTKERLRPGAVPDAEPVELDPAKLAQMVSRNQFG